MVTLDPHSQVRKKFAACLPLNIVEASYEQILEKKQLVADYFRFECQELCVEDDLGEEDNESGIEECWFCCI
jgi:hypothetical protein